MTAHPWWHIVWTTFLARSPADARGDWSALAERYAELIARHGAIEMSSSLQQRWQGQPDADGVVRLSAHAQDVATRELRTLADSDRVAGDTPIRAVAVGTTSVQIVLACPAEALHQRIGRLKSRSATVLSFDPAAGTGGKGTWSRGFWWARLPNDDCVEAVTRHIAT